MLVGLDYGLGDASDDQVCQEVGGYMKDHASGTIGFNMENAAENIG